VAVELAETDVVEGGIEIDGKPAGQLRREALALAMKDVEQILLDFSREMIDSRSILLGEESRQ
jgi:hypothetical protein